MSANESIWQSNIIPTSIEKRPLDDRYDVAVIGAGVAGASTAFHLAGRGLKVALLESRSIFRGVTGKTTGKLTSQHGLIYKHLRKTFGQEKAVAYARANEWAIQFVRETSAAFAIECDLAEEAAYVYAPEGDFSEEHEACQAVGLPTSLVSLQMPFGDVNAIRMEGQARFHPTKFLSGLLGLAATKGVHVSENMRALEVEEHDQHVEITTNLGQIYADHVVIATHYPIHDSGWFVAKLAPYRSYALALRLNEPALDGMYISDNDPMRSLRKHSDESGEYQLVGGEHHKVGQEPDTNGRYQTLRTWALANFNVAKIEHQWSTQDNWTPDQLPYIGKSPHRDRIFVATGFGGWGMTNGIVSGKLISDLILGRDNDAADLYDPSRMELAAIPSLVSENLNVATRLIGDRVKGVDYQGLEELEPGTGGIVQMSDKRIAAYKDAQGNCTTVSTVCTHLGCQVAWNEAEFSWDCPCHGSRFSIDGSVIQGPATKALDPVSTSD